MSDWIMQEVWRSTVYITIRLSYILRRGGRRVCIYTQMAAAHSLYSIYIYFHGSRAYIRNCGQISIVIQYRKENARRERKRERKKLLDYIHYYMIMCDGLCLMLDDSQPVILSKCWRNHYILRRLWSQTADRSKQTTFQHSASTIRTQEENWLYTFF